MSSSLLPPSSTALAAFARPSRLSVRQRKRWSEILLGWDAKNTYVVYDDAGNPVFNVEEQGQGFGNFLKRLFLRGMRPFESHVEDLASQRRVLTLQRPFRFIFHRLEIHGPDGALLGAIQRRWTWVRRKYEVEGPDGTVLAILFGPFWKPWTFQIQLAGTGEEVGVLQKKWSGLMKEAFTQADNFWIELDRVPDPNLRALLFAATVLVDVVHFERN